MSSWSVLLLTIAATLASGGQLLFRVGARGRTGITALMNLHVAGGLVLYAVGTVIWIYALSKEELVDAYAFTALTFALVYLGAVLLLNERLNVSSAAGVGFVLLGLFLITRAGG